LLGGGPPLGRRRGSDIGCDDFPKKYRRTPTKASAIAPGLYSDVDRAPGCAGGASVTTSPPFTVLASAGIRMRTIMVQRGPFSWYPHDRQGLAVLDMDQVMFHIRRV